MTHSKRWLIPVLLGLLTLSACASSGDKAMSAADKPMVATEKSLYDRLGGKEAITAVIDDFVARVAADTRINGFFASADIPRLKAGLVNQVCQASGGPCTYTGQDMQTVHRGMGITNVHFDALVQDLVATLDKFKVPAKEKSELLAVLGPMRKDIVER
jgi:hemoglobin